MSHLEISGISSNFLHPQNKWLKLDLSFIKGFKLSNLFFMDLF